MSLLNNLYEKIKKLELLNIPEVVFEPEHVGENAPHIFFEEYWIFEAANNKFSVNNYNTSSQLILDEKGVLSYVQGIDMGIEFSQFLVSGNQVKSDIDIQSFLMAFSERVSQDVFYKVSFSNL